MQDAQEEPSRVRATGGSAERHSGAVVLSDIRNDSVRKRAREPPPHGGSVRDSHVHSGSLDPPPTGRNGVPPQLLPAAANRGLDAAVANQDAHLVPTLSGTEGHVGPGRRPDGRRRVRALGCQCPRRNQKLFEQWIANRDWNIRLNGYVCEYCAVYEVPARLAAK